MKTLLTACLAVLTVCCLAGISNVSALSSLTGSELRTKTLFKTLEDFTRQHPETVHQLLISVVNHISDEEERRTQMEIMENVFANTLAMEGHPCMTCKALAQIVKVVIRVDGYDEFEKSLMDYCEVLFNALDPTQANSGKEQCGVIRYQGPHIAAILATINNGTWNRTSLDDICMTLNACFETPDNGTVLMRPHDAHKLPDSAKVRPHRTKRQGNSQLVIAQITDVHVEKDYKENTNDQCALYVCCQEYQGPGSSKPYGSYHCNIPLRTMELFLDKVISFSPDMVIFSGDVPPHTMWDETLESQLECTRTLANTLTDKLSAAALNVSVYPSIGNHEMFPTDMFSIRSIPEYTEKMVESFTEYWENLAGYGEEQIDSMLQGGFYSMLTRHNKLRVLSLNTNYMYCLNYYNAVNHKLERGFPENGYEATRMKNDIVNILTAARRDGEKVIIVNHHPPGGGDYIIAQSRWYESLAVNFSDVIVLQVAGHTHTDEFRLMKDSSNEVKSMLYVSPSIDTSWSRNPSMRLYYLDSETYELLDYEQYYLSIPLSGNGVPDITFLYRATEEYGLPDMSAASWESLLKRFETDEPLLLKHYRHSYANAEGEPPEPCDEACRRGHICRQLHANYDHYEVCAAGIVEPTTPATPTTPLSTTWPPLTRLSAAPTTPTTPLSTTLPPVIPPSAAVPSRASGMTLIFSFTVLIMQRVFTHL